ncbi:uridine kinase [Lachnospiraceae bacterium A10]|jgi:uridine kinase|nr:uridine kinase [Lachnospiraceae bacterium A10]
MKIKWRDEEWKVPEGTTFQELSERVQDQYPDDIVLAVFQNKLRELWNAPSEDGVLEFVTTAQENGQRTYRRSVIFMMQKALSILLGEKPADVKVLYSIGQGYYCQMSDGRVLSDDELRELKKIMKDLVLQDLPMEKYTMRTDDARSMFRESGMNNKDRLLRYRSSSNINIYELDGIKDYFYGYMAPSTGYLRYFDIFPYDEGFVLQFPDLKHTREVAMFHPAQKLFQVLKTNKKWSDTMEIPTVGALNDAIAAGKANDIILMQEALMEARIGELAREIISNPSRKFVLIAGPSSSGKTTFAHRLSTQLRALGAHPHPLSLDDYYKPRSEMPLDEFGEKDFESIEGLKIDEFNDHMQRLLRGERVLLPTFNFIIGKGEYRDHYMQLGENDILVIEGIHGLNERMTESLPAESKYKIYISALTQLSIDEHNPLSTTDGRLIRRIVRDARTRGTSAQETIAMWDSVRRGERMNIFPFQEQADVMFNSALIYEMSVLKLYAQPQLYAIEKGAPEYDEANRLLKLLDYFLPIPPESISSTSLVREFIGGGIFNL